jgi:hypothetical protein
LAVVTSPGVVLTPYGQTISKFVQGTLFSAVVAGFTDSNPQAFPAQFTATINWGDGSSPSAGVISISGSGFNVTGSHTYFLAGTYPLSVSIHDALTGTTVTANGTANVAQMPITITTRSILVTGGVPFSGTLATFTDAEPRTNRTYYTVTINWGDGTPNTAGTVTGSNPFTVKGTHTFAGFPGTDLVTITVTAGDGRTAVGVDEAFDPVRSSPAPADVLTMVAESLVLSRQKPFNGTVATFQASDPSEPASAYKASINWGKGRRTAGMITGSNGRFVVTARNAFPRFSGTRQVIVTVTEPDGQSVSVSDWASYPASVAGRIKLSRPARVAAKSDR